MKKIFLYVAIGLTLLAIPATVFLVGQQQEIRKRAAPATTLSLSPTTVTKEVDETFKLNVDIDPATNQVTTVKVYLTYDPAVLTATAITNGANAPKILTSGIIESGTASITVGAGSNAQPIATRGTVAVITLQAIAGTGTATSNVQFASNTFVGGLNEPTANVLVGTTGASVTISGAAPSLTPTTTPSATLTSTLTPTLPATTSGEATSSAIQIVSPTANDSVTSTSPTIQGKAPPGSTVTLTIYSEPQTVTVTVDADGNWSYTPTTALETGPHNVVASVITASGATETASTSFVISGEEGSSSDIPVSGSIETTILLMAIGIALLLFGAIVPI